jgi:AraC-like DNA-binding protein
VGKLPGMTLVGATVMIYIAGARTPIPRRRARCSLPLAMDHGAPPADRPHGGIWYVTSAGRRFPLERHDELELNLVVAGSGSVVIGGDIRLVRRGTLIWLLPGQWHCVTRASRDFALWVALFSSDLVDSLRADDRTLGEGSGTQCVCLGENALQRLSQRCFGLVNHRAPVAPFNLAIAELLLDAWQTRTLARGREREPHRAVAQAAALLTYSEDRWSLPSLAKRVGLSPFQLSRAFHGYMGVTLAHYANHQRVQLFEYLFADGKRQTMLAAALEAGFGSYSQFFRMFRLVTGQTPETHRKLVQNLCGFDAVPFANKPMDERWAYPVDPGTAADDDRVERGPKAQDLQRRVRNNPALWSR